MLAKRSQTSSRPLREILGVLREALHSIKKYTQELLKISGVEMARNVLIVVDLKAQSLEPRIRPLTGRTPLPIYTILLHLP